MTYVPGTEVASFPEGSQFEGGESAYLCVFFGIADIAASGQPGSPPIQSWEWTDKTADNLANTIQGSGSFDTSQGASLDDEHAALNIMHLSWKNLDLNIQSIKDAIREGVPVLLCAEEDSYIDTQTGRVNYTWTPTGNHCIVCSGYTISGDLIVRDYASVILKPGSRREYRSDAIKFVSATAVWPYWKDRTMGLPSGWTDNGTTMTAPNGNTVTLGFRSYIMDHPWEPDDTPLEEGHGANPVLYHNTGVGAGTVQLFTKSMLWWTSKSGVVNEPNLGEEIFALNKRLSSYQSSQPPLDTSILEFTSSVVSALNSFTSSLQTSQASGGPPVSTLLAKLAGDISSSLQKLESSTASSSSVSAVTASSQPSEPILHL